MNSERTLGGRPFGQALLSRYRVHQWEYFAGRLLHDRIVGGLLVRSDNHGVSRRLAF